MDSRYLRCAALAGLAVFSLSCQRAGIAARPDRVDVRLVCTSSGKSSVSIDGWRLPRHGGEGLSWRLLTGGNADSIVISPKNSANWPISPPPPYVGRKGAADITATVNNDAPLGTYSYTIRAYCPSGTTPPAFDIDPDIVVD